MKLATYRERSGLTLEQFAARIGASNATVVHRYETGKRTPRPNMMAAITRETGGAVTANDFFDVEPAEALPC